MNILPTTPLRSDLSMSQQLYASGPPLKPADLHQSHNTVPSSSNPFYHSTFHPSASRPAAAGASQSSSAAIDSFEQTVDLAEHSRTSMLLGHIGDLRQLLKTHLQREDVMKISIVQQSDELRQCQIYIDLLTEINQASCSDDMFAICSQKLQQIFHSQKACVFTLDTTSHELVTREGHKTISGSPIVFHAAHSDFPYNLTSEDPALMSLNNANISSANSPTAAFINNALISRLVDENNRVLGIVYVQNHLSQPRYSQVDEVALALLLKPLTAVARTIERCRQFEIAIAAGEERVTKLERAADSTWLLGGVIDDALSKVGAVTNSRRARLWVVDTKNETFSLYQFGTERKVGGASKASKLKPLTAALGTGIVGHTALTGEVVNIQNPSSDPRFEANIDSLSDEVPNSVVCTPIFSQKDGTMLGVLHLCGRKGASLHSPDDVRLSEMFAGQLATVVESLVAAANPDAAHTEALPSFNQLSQDQRSFTSLVAAQMISIESNVTTLCEIIETQLATIVKADHIALYLYDDATKIFVGASYSQPESFPLNAGISGDAASTRTIACVPNVHRDPNFSFEVDSQMDKLSHSAVYVPITTRDGVRVQLTKAGRAGLHNLAVRGGGASENEASSNNDDLIGLLQVLRSRRGKSDNPFSSGDVDEIQRYSNAIMPSLNDWRKYQGKLKTLKAAQLKVEHQHKRMQELESQAETAQSIFDQQLQESFGSASDSFADLIQLVGQVSASKQYALEEVGLLLESNIPRLFPNAKFVRFCTADADSGTIQIGAIVNSVRVATNVGITGMCWSRRTILSSSDDSVSQYFNAKADSATVGSPSVPGGASVTCLTCIPLSGSSASKDASKDTRAVIQVFSPSPLTAKDRVFIHRLSNSIASLLECVDAIHEATQEQAILKDAVASLSEQVIHQKQSTQAELELLEGAIALSSSLLSPATVNGGFEQFCEVVNALSKRLFKCSSATLLRSESSSVYSTYFEGKVIATSISPLEGRCLATRKVVRLTERDCEHRSDGALDIQIRRVVKSIMCGPIPRISASSAGLQDTYGLIQVANPDTEFTSLDEDKLSKWTSYVSIALQLSEAHHETRRSLETSSVLEDGFFEAIKEFNERETSLTFFLNASEQRAAKLYDAYRATVYVLDGAAHELYCLDPGRRNEIIRMSSTCGIPGQVVKSGKTSKFSADRDRSLMTKSATGMDYFTSNSATGVVVVCCPIMMQESVIAVIELVLSSSSDSSEKVKSIVNFATCIAAPICRYLDVSHVREECINSATIQKSLLEHLVSFSDSLCSRDELDSIEEDVFSIPGDVFRCEQAVLYIHIPAGRGGKSFLKSTVPSEHIVNLPSTSVVGLCLAQRQIVGVLSHGQRKIGIPIFEAGGSDKVAAVLLLSKSNDADLDQAQVSATEQVTRLLSSHIRRVQRLAEQRAVYSDRFSSQASEIASLKAKLARSEYLHKISDAVNSGVDIVSLFETIVLHSCNFMNAERATLFLLDRANKELYYRSRNSAEIRFSQDLGIAGSTVQSRSIISIPDAYRDPRFNREIDLKTGFVTKSILSGALRNEQGEVVGVLQVINKRDGPFNEDDIRLMEELFEGVGATISHRVRLQATLDTEKDKMDSKLLEKEDEKNKRIEMYERELQSKEKAQIELSAAIVAGKQLLELSESLAQNLSTVSVFEQAVKIAPTVMRSERATLFLIDRVTNELYSFTKSARGSNGSADNVTEIRIPLSSGIAGFVASSSQVVRLKDAYLDPRFNKEVDLRTGFVTKSILCGPVQDRHGKTLGVLQLVNKSDGSTDFSDSDEKLLYELTGVIGNAVEKCFLSGDERISLEERLESERRRSKQAEAERVQLEKENSLLRLTDELSSDSELSSLFAQVVEYAPRVMSAERATLWLYHASTSELYSRSTSNQMKEIRISSAGSIAGHVARTGETVNIANAYTDPRFNRDVDTKLGLVTKEVFCAPIRDSENAIIGVLQVMNSTTGAPFDKESETLAISLNRKIGAVASRCLRYKEEQDQVSAALEAERESIKRLKEIGSKDSQTLSALQRELHALKIEKEELRVKLTEENELAASIIDQEKAAKRSLEQEIHRIESMSSEQIAKLSGELTKESTEKEMLRQEESKLCEKIRRKDALDRIGGSLAKDLNIKSLFEQVCAHSIDLVGADRSSLFLIDRDNNELWSMVAQGTKEIRIPLTSGVAGHVACTGETLNIANAYQDVRFNKSVDIQTGYTTRTIMCAPIIDDTGEILGALQLINKKKGEKFTAEDEELIHELNRKVGTAITKCLIVLKLQKGFDERMREEKRIEEALQIQLSGQTEEHRKQLREKDLALEMEYQKELALQTELSRERSLQRVAQALATDLEIHNLFDQVCEHACDLMDADRATLFLVDVERDQLWSQIAHKTDEIRIPLGIGIAGFVATTGELVNIQDAYKDPRFNPEVDKKSGYRTKTILCAPMREQSGSIVGVLQVINKSKGTFSENDELLMHSLGATIASAVHRCQQYCVIQNSLITEKGKELSLQEELMQEKALAKISQCLANDYEMQNLFAEVCHHACSFLKSDRATLFLVDHAKGELWSQIAHGTGEIRLPIGVGVAGFVASSGDLVNITDAYNDHRFNPEYDRKSGYKTKTILACPLKEHRGNIIGVLQVINKEGGLFSSSDEKMIQSLGVSVAAAIHKCQDHFDMQARLDAERRTETLLREQIKRSKTMQTMSQAIANDMQMKTLFDEVCTNAKDMMRADRATMFLVDHHAGEIWSQVAHGTSEIRVPLGVGIAGTVATVGEMVNIREAYDDSRFNPEFDRKTGYRTKSILCGPIKEVGGGIVGVLQIINKEGGVFTKADEEVMAELNETIATGVLRCREYNRLKQEMEAKERERIAAEESLNERLSNDRLESDKRVESIEAQYREKLSEEERRAAELEAMLQEEQKKEMIMREKEKMYENLLLVKSEEAETHALEGLQGLTKLSAQYAQNAGKRDEKYTDALFEQICSHAMSFMKADSATIFFWDRAKHILWSRPASERAEMKFSADSGITGEACTSGLLMNVGDPDIHPKFNKAVDSKAGVKTVNLLCAPIFKDEDAKKIIGVLQIMNKTSGAFNSKDEQKAVLLAKQVSSALLMSATKLLEEETSRRPPELSLTSSTRVRSASQASITSVQSSSSGYAQSPKMGSPSPRSPSTHISTSPRHGASFLPSTSFSSPPVAAGESEKALQAVGSFVASLTNDANLHSPECLCDLVSRDAPKILNMSNVSLWIMDDSGVELWHQRLEGERLGCSCDEGVVGSAINGKVTTTLTKPSWTEIGMRIPGMGYAEKPNLVACVPVVVGGEVIAMLQVVSLDKAHMSDKEEELAGLLAKLVGFSLLTLRLSEKIVENDTVLDRVLSVTQPSKVLQLMDCKNLATICDEVVNVQVNSLLKRHTSSTLYLADSATQTLIIQGKGDFSSKISMQGDADVVGRCGFWGAIQILNNDSATDADALKRGNASVPRSHVGEKRIVSSPGVTAVALSPTKLMMTMSGINSGRRNAGRFSPIPVEGETVRAICLPLVVPFSESNLRYGIANNEGSITVGVLRVCEDRARLPQSYGNFTASDIRSLSSYSSQLTVMLCSHRNHQRVVEEMRKESLAQHKKDKKVAWFWKKLFEDSNISVERMGSLCGDILSVLTGPVKCSVGKGDGVEEKKDIEDQRSERMVEAVSRCGFDIMKCEHFGLVMREDLDLNSPSSPLVPRELIMQAFRRGVVVKSVRTEQEFTSRRNVCNKDSRALSAVLCVPMWGRGSAPPLGVLYAVRSPPNQGPPAEFSDNDEVLANTLCNIMVLGIQAIRDFDGFCAGSRQSSKERERGASDVGNDTRVGGLPLFISGPIDVASIASKLSSTMSLDSLPQVMSSAVTDVVKSCSVYMYLVDSKQNSLRPLFPGLSANLPMSSGILGYVATTARTEVVVCARLHRLFDSKVDDHSKGRDSQPMIYLPLQDSRGKCVGIMQVVGKERDAAFSQAEVDVLEGLSKFAEDALHRCCMMETLSSESYHHKQLFVKASEEVDALKSKLNLDNESGREERKRLLKLLKICRSMLLEKSIAGVMTFSEIALKNLLSSDRASVYLVDGAARELYCIGGGGVEVRVPMGKGIVGHTVSTGKVVNMSHELESVVGGASLGGDGRGRKGLDLSSGTDVRIDSDYRTTSILCMPIFNAENITQGKGVVIGVIMVQNKMDGSRAFTSVDEGLLGCFCDFLGVALFNTELQERALSVTSSVHEEFTGMASRIDELVIEKKAMETANALLAVEEETQDTRNKALFSLLDVEKELDSQRALLDELLK